MPFVPITEIYVYYYRCILFVTSRIYDKQMLNIYVLQNNKHTLIFTVDKKSLLFSVLNDSSHRLRYSIPFNVMILNYKIYLSFNNNNDNCFDYVSFNCIWNSYIAFIPTVFILQIFCHKVCFSLINDFNSRFVWKHTYISVKSTYSFVWTT